MSGETDVHVDYVCQIYVSEGACKAVSMGGSVGVSRCVNIGEASNENASVDKGASEMRMG